MRKIAVVIWFLAVSFMLLGCQATPGKTINVSVPGEYEIQMAYSVEVDVASTITVLLDTIEVFADGSLKLNMVWTAEVGMDSMTSIRKGSDAGNTNIFLKDDLSNKYNHVDGSGAAYEVEDLYDGSTLTGGYYFPALSTEAKHIVFHDLDVEKSIGPIGVRR